MIDAPQRAIPSLHIRGVSLRRLAAGWRARTGPMGRPLLWLLLCCVVLAALPFLSHPGQIIADTKIDLAINPAGFLRRALHLWDPSQFGQLQDQAVGYFFPVGPFFLVGKLVALPGWVVQRFWISFLLLAAFLGVVRLGRLLEIGNPATRIVAGLAYALSPAGLSLLGSLSSEFLPVAMLPWILIPLVRAVRAGPDVGWASRLRAAAQSAVAVAMCSGINAAATSAVLIPPVIYLLTAPRPAPRWRILAWWVPAVLLATFWWLYPLYLLSKYGVSILPYTESAAITTSVTSLSNSLRGTENWITYLVVNGKPWWPVGYRISTGTVATVVTGLIAGLGLTGIAGRRMPHRRFLLCVLLAGIFLIATGYVGALGNPLAGPLDHVINGPLAPLRNLRKFDPLIRLPVALGLAGLLTAARPGVSRRMVAVAAACAIGVLAAPVYASGLSTPGSFSRVPGYWVSAAAWLDRHAGNAAVLEEPGARFGQYTWGSPLDDILEPLYNGDWASSQLSAIGSVGNTRLLEAIDQQMAAGDGSAGLTALLARMGVKYLLVRNDLIRSDLRGAWPARIHEAIAASPGLVKVAQFGSPVGSSAPANAVSSFDSPYPPVQIYQVTGAQPVAVVQPTADTMRVYGAPEALLTLADQGLLKNRPVLLNSAAPQVHAGSTVVTDSLRRRVRNFGEIRDDYSPTLTPGQPLTTFEATADYMESDWLPYLAVARYTGITNVTASSSDSDYDAPPNQSATGRLPFAALDGNLQTMWESGSLGGPVGQWIKVNLARPVSTRSIRVAFADDIAIGPQVSRVEVSTAAGQVSDRTAMTGRYQSLRMPSGPTDWLQITVTGVFHPPASEVGRQVGIAEIAIPGVTPSRAIEAPDVRVPGGGDPSAVVLAKAEPQPSGCMPTSQQWVCSPDLEKPTEEQYGFDEGFTISRGTTAWLSGSAVLTSPALIRQYVFAGKQQPVVTASSTYTSDPEDQAWAAFDGNARTTWISGASDAHPKLTISWRRSRRIDEITVQRPAGALGPLPVQLTGSGGQVRNAVLGGPRPASTQTLAFAPMKTSQLTLTFFASQGPVQITNVEIPGVRPLSSDGAARVALACGSGPAISVGGKPVPTRISGTVADLLDGQPMAFSACGPVAVAAGHTDIVEPYSDGFSVQSVVVDRRAPRLLSAHAVAPAQPAAVRLWTPASRVVQVSATGPSYLIVNENFNSGWQAKLAGHVLQPVQLDGWKQGWLLPAGSRGLVTLNYQPDSAYRMSLFGGLAALAVVMIIAFAPVVRKRRRPAPVSETPASQGAALFQGRQPALPAARPEISAPLSRHPRRTAAALVGSLLISALGGLWIGGYPGALLLPIAVGTFMTAAAFRRSSAVGRLLWDPWLLAVFLVGAAVAGAVGDHLTSAGDSSGIAVALSGAIPQLLCLVIAGRLIASLLLPDVTGLADSADAPAPLRQHRGVHEAQTRRPHHGPARS
jgi:arabinofuranan 3-O-arabinosyltransferase